jgi:phosphatidylglycerol lysyltransferase
MLSTGSAAGRRAPDRTSRRALHARIAERLRAGPFLPDATLVWLAGVLTFGSGLFNLFSLVGPKVHGRTRLLLEVFPIEFLHASRFVTLVIGFALAVSSVNLVRRKRRAFLAVVILTVLSIVIHLVKTVARGVDWEHAAFSFVLLLVLIRTRKLYRVGSGVPRWRSVGPGLVTAFVVAVGYGVAGFWFLDRRQFGVNFTLPDALRKTLRVLSLVSDPAITPLTRHARWFLDSLYLMTFTALVYAVVALYRPVLYKLRSHPREVAQARALVRFFKTWPDKSYFFAPSGQGFIAYGVGGSFAVALGDPVGPQEEIERMVRDFLRFCHENDWGIAFHQATPSFLEIYHRAGLKKLKIGDEALVDLNAFNLDGRERRGLRHTVNLLDKTGVRARLVDPPVGPADLERAHEVSDAWLTIPGRRERGFTLGRFDEDYLRSTPLFAVEDAGGRMLAFANIIPSYAPRETTVDLMRHRPDAPNGIMDYLFLKLFQQERERGFERFNLGMAPMSGFQEREEATAEERAVHLFFQRLNFLFSYRGLRAYKAKFATIWEPRYAIYRNAFDLPRLALALSIVSGVKEEA